MKFIEFEVSMDETGTHTAKAVGHDIFTEADTYYELKDRAREAVRCHFGDYNYDRVVFTNDTIESLIVCFGYKSLSYVEVAVRHRFREYNITLGMFDQLLNELNNEAIEAAGPLYEKYYNTRDGMMDRAINKTIAHRNFQRNIDAIHEAAGQADNTTDEERAEMMRLQGFESE